MFLHYIGVAQDKFFLFLLITLTLASGYDTMSSHE